MASLAQPTGRMVRQITPPAAEPAGLAIVCFSGEWDRLFAAFTMATGALAQGREVHMFFTFWGTVVARQQIEERAPKSLLQRMFGWLQPGSVAAAPLTHLNFGGAGKVMLAKLMHAHGVDEIDGLIQDAVELGAHFHYCETSMRMMGLVPEDVAGADSAQICGVSEFLRLVDEMGTTLFI